MKSPPYPVHYTESEWRMRLTREQYHILREKGTEYPGTCALLLEKRPGVFRCVGCGQKLFMTSTKFESGTGWPSFKDPVPGALETSLDMSTGHMRTEVHCARCGGHLGHVFEDGPPPTYLRYCINGVVLTFQPQGDEGDGR